MSFFPRLTQTHNYNRLWYSKKSTTEWFLDLNRHRCPPVLVCVFGTLQFHWWILLNWSSNLILICIQCWMSSFYLICHRSILFGVWIKHCRAWNEKVEMHEWKLVPLGEARKESYPENKDFRCLIKQSQFWSNISGSGWAGAVKGGQLSSLTRVATKTHWID